MDDVWPWLVIAGLGVYHGANPATGWLFAAGLAVERQSRAVALQALVPIGAGHAVSIAIVAATVAAAGLAVDMAAIRVGSGVALVGWAAWHLLRRHRRRAPIGAATSLAGLALWSFLMATAHGAGLMLIPALLPLCLPGGVASSVQGSFATALAAVGLHTAAMLAVTGAIAVLASGSAQALARRRGPITLDGLWVAALLVTGLILIRPW